MLNQQTINKLYELKLTGMADAFADQIKQPDRDKLSFAERFGLIVDRPSGPGRKTTAWSGI